MSQSIFEILQQVTESIPGCAFTSIVDASTGMSLASVPGPQQTEGSPEAADAYHSDLYRLVSRALDALESHQSLRGLVLHSEKFTFISQPLPDSTYMWHVVTVSATTVGFTQAMMRKFQPGVLEMVGPLMM